MQSNSMIKDLLLPNEEIKHESKKFSNWIATIIFLVISLPLPALLIFSIPMLFLSIGASKTVYAITNKRVIVKKGILSTSIIQCPLDKVQNIDLYKGLMSWCGKIRFDTAGGIQKEIVWDCISEPQKVFNIVSSLLHK